MKETWTSARRALRVLKLLKGQSLDGLTQVEIGTSLGESPANVSRAVAVLEEEGLVTRLETGRIAHSVLMMQMARAHADAIMRAQDRLSELTRRIDAGATHHNS